MSEKLKPCPSYAPKHTQLPNGWKLIRREDGEDIIHHPTAGIVGRMSFGDDFAKAMNTRAQPEAVTNAGDALSSHELARRITNMIFEGQDVESVIASRAEIIAENTRRVVAEHVAATHQLYATAEADLARAREVIAKMLTAGIILDPFLPNKVPGFAADTHTPHVRASHGFRAALTTARNYLEGISEFKQRAEQKGNG